MQRPSFCLKVSQRNDLLIIMTKLLYCTTDADYDTRYEALRQYCEDNKRPAIFSYFEKNWNSCRDMWSNFVRGNFFTAGNTTTNRIESNWNQVKLLLDHKTRIDKTIAGLLLHQITITQQIVSTIGLHNSTSRMPKAVTRFLRGVATRLSTDVFVKLKKEWERLVTLMAGATCNQITSSPSAWKVRCSNQTYTCDDVDWICNGLFYCSHHLPCRHLMHLARKEHGFKRLPTMAIHERWSLSCALDVKEELAAAAASLQLIGQMSKLKSPKLRLPETEPFDYALVWLLYHTPEPIVMDSCGDLFARRAHMGALRTFYDIKARCRSWIEDRSWLEKDWRRLTPTFRLRTTFVTRTNSVLVGFDNIIGSLCRGWLNDSAVDFCMEAIVGSVGQYLLLSTLTGVVETEGLIDFVKRWNQASENPRQLAIDPIEWVETPQQPDYACCGVMVVAQTYRYLTGSLQLQQNNVSKEDVCVMRLKMLWMVMCHSKERQISAYDAANVSKIHQMLLNQL
ncbi:unnamed protein product [Phytophthora fragariaefolia]|uniref:Unnamed protein product n=1 Tax=Phytophthora fragariaefolia TaxID=1490495 RepID=A0A9W7D4P4_9STRA|nr:unnamed protein product [Phytophthora fragariaefolia]